MTNSTPPIAVTPPDIGSPATYFDRKKFDDLIYDKGYEAYIDRAVQCPCRTLANGQALSDCQNCGGVGWFYIDRVQSVLGCTSMANRNKYEVWTVSNAGTVNITSRPEDKLGWMDRITLLELESWFSQALYLKLITSGDQAGNWFTFLTYEPTEVFDVFIFMGSAVPVGYLNSSQYTISGNKIIIPSSTISGLAITLPQLSIAIRYVHNPSYYVIDINRDLIKQRVSKCFSPATLSPEKTNLPLNAIGKRAHFVLDAADFANDNLFDNTPTRPLINYDI